MLQRASQIRSVPFTGDSSDSDNSDGEGGGRGGQIAHPEDVFDGVFRGSSSRNTTATTTTTMTSSTSGEMQSLSSPRGLTTQLKMASTHFKHQNMLCLPATAKASATNKLG